MAPLNMIEMIKQIFRAMLITDVFAQWLIEQENVLKLLKF